MEIILPMSMARTYIARAFGYSSMTRERVRDSKESIKEADNDGLALNGGSVEDPDAARENIMSRFEAGESILQPPGDTDETLGEAIRRNLRKHR